MTSEQIVEEILKGGDRRSEPYRFGMIAVMNFKRERKPMPPVPYAVGTAEADAYFAGVDRGWFEWRLMRGVA
jgi:hypothetical protein